MRTLLTSRGYSHVYTYLTLVAEVALTPESSDAEWHDVDASNLDAVYACYRDAFRETAVPVASPEEARAVLLGADPRARVLFAGGEAAAVLRVAWLDEAARTAQLRFVCRNPRFHGQRLGDRALSETFRILRRTGASSVGWMWRRRIMPHWICTTDGGFGAWSKKTCSGSRSLAQ
jgi:hypothetical protein